MLGKAKRDHNRAKGATSVVTDIDKDDRLDFRILAHALDGECEPPITADDWRKSRRAFLSLVRVPFLLHGRETAHVLQQIGTVPHEADVRQTDSIRRPDRWMEPFTR